MKGRTDRGRLTVAGLASVLADALRDRYVVERELGRGGSPSPFR
jgi:hypothetical protein